LDDPVESGELKDGAKFLLRFTKDRNSRTEQAAMEWTFQTLSDGDVSISTKCADGCEVLLEWVRDGLTSATDIAAEMGLSKGTISKMARRLMDEGRLKITDREYKLP
jgi:DNA-binding NarL/FixJ family response regulator